MELDKLDKKFGIYELMFFLEKFAFYVAGPPSKRDSGLFPHAFVSN